MRRFQRSPPRASAADLKSQARVTYEETIQTVPTDPEKAWNYEALLALWNQQRARTEVTAQELEAWSQSVLGLLRYSERQLFLDESILASGIIGGGELNRLTRILLARHGRIDQPTSSAPGREDD